MSRYINYYLDDDKETNEKKTNLCFEENDEYLPIYNKLKSQVLSICAEINEKDEINSLTTRFLRLVNMNEKLEECYCDFFIKKQKLKDIEAIEVFALAYMRGMNIDNSILIFEEAQNCSPKQMKLLLTRIGFNSKFFISGDIEQTDRYKDKTHSGLWDAIEKFKNISEIGVHEFGDDDVVRNPLITEILKRYEDRN